MSSEKNPGWLFDVGDYTTQLYTVGILINHYKDPNKPTSIMESRRVIFVAQFISPLVGGYNSPFITGRGPPRSCWICGCIPWLFPITTGSQVGILGWVP